MITDFVDVGVRLLSLMTVSGSALLAFVLARLLYYVIVKKKRTSASDIASPSTEHVGDERQMDFFELVLDKLHSYGGANICCGFRLKSAISLEYNNVREALDHVARKYPFLRTVVIEKRNSRSEEPLKYLRVLAHTIVDLKQLDIDDKDWVDVWQDQVQRTFDCKQGPLWNTVLLKERYDPLDKTYYNTFFFTFYHGIVDGMSVLKVAQTFLCYLNDVTEGKRSFGMDNMCTTPPQSMLELLAPQQSLHYRIMQHFLPASLLLYFVKFGMRVRKMFIAKNPLLAKYADKTRRAQEKLDGRIKLIARELSTENTDRLIRLCRKNRCTVQGAMVACCHLAVGKLVQSWENVSPLDLNWYCPVNIRAQCGYMEDKLGSFTSILNENARVPRISTDNANELWAFAVQCTRTLHSNIRRGRHLYTLYLIPIAHLLNPVEFVDEFIAYTDMEETESISPAFSLTNLGKIELKSEGVYEIENVFGGSGAYRHGATFMNHIATCNGVFTWSTSYHTGCTSDDVANVFVTYVFEILQAMLQNENLKDN